MAQNVVSITVDDLIAFLTVKNMFGDVLHTPNMDRLMAMGINFDNAFSQIALCNPSRTSVLTGERPSSTQVHDNLVNAFTMIDTARTLPALLAASGFETSLLGKVFHLTSGQIGDLPGFAPIHRFSDITGWNNTTLPFRIGALSIPETSHGDYINTSEAIRLINGWTDTSSNAVFLGIYRPHQDWVVPQQYLDMYPLESITLPNHPIDDLNDVPEFMRELINDYYHGRIIDADMWQKAIQAYFASISFADAQIGRVLDALEAGGHMDDTAIVVWSDHGYHLGDKTHWHKFDLWDESARAALIVYDPSITEPGRTISTPVELLDIAPTILDMLGLPPSGTYQGQSLTDFFDPATPDSGGQAITTMYGSASIRTDMYRYIRYEDGSEELYNVLTDPNETVNLANSPDLAEIKAQLWGELRVEMEAQNWYFLAADASFAGESVEHTFSIQPGAHTVTGGNGNDTYFIIDALSTLQEAVNGGIDSVYAATSFVLPENFENLFFRTNESGRTASMTGNSLANDIAGGSFLYGLAGNDRLTLSYGGLADGGSGDDHVQGSNQNDHLIGGTGNDVVIASGGDDLVVGGDGNDLLNGGFGNDVIRPGAGNDDVRGMSGTDTLDFSDLSVLVNVDMVARKATSSVGTVSFIDMEDVTGSSGGMTVIGDARNSVFRVTGGDNTIDGAGGTDTVVLPVALDQIGSIVSAPNGGWVIKYFHNGTARTLKVSNVENIAGPGTQGSIPIAQLSVAAHTNFDGDGGDDLLTYRRSDGQVLVIDGAGAPGVQRNFGLIAPERMLGIGDFNGDGAADLLYATAAGEIKARSGVSGTDTSYGIRTGQTLIATDDFNGDGSADLLFQRQSDGAAFVISGKGGYLYSFGIFGLGAIEGIGDFNGDGAADIVVRQANGVLLTKNGFSSTSVAFDGRAAINTLAVGNFDNDAADEILVQRVADGLVYVMNGSSNVSQKNYGVQTGTLMAVGDLNGDGIDDLVFRQVDGKIVALNGATASAMLNNRDGHQFLGLADLDGDGGLDLLMVRESDGFMYALNGDTGAYQRGFGLNAGSSFLGFEDLGGDGGTDILLRTAAGQVRSIDGSSGAITSHAVPNGFEVLLPESEMTGMLPDLFA